VAQQLLHVADAGAGAQEMSRAAVTKGMRRGFNFNLESVVADAIGDHLIRKTTPGDGKPKCGSWRNDFGLATSSAFAPKLAGRQLRTRHRDVTSQPMRGGLSEWHEAIALALAKTNSQALRGRVHVVEVQTMRFRVPNAGGVERFQQGAIAQADRRRNAWTLD
jgi:hypothetical protein